MAGLQTRLLEPSSSRSEINADKDASACIDLAPETRQWMGKNLVNSVYWKGFILLCVLVDGVSTFPPRSLLRA
jgi:hypothetical protein